MVKKLSCGLSLTMKYFFLLIQQLRSISEDLAQTLKKKSGQKLCSSCHKKKTEKNKEASEAEKNNDNKEYLPSPNSEKSNYENFEDSPLKSVAQCAFFSYGRRKGSHVYATSAEMTADVLDISTDDITVNKSVNNAECCQKVTDFERLMKSVKEKISISNTQEKMKLLILVPTSWAIRESSSFFEVPESMIKKAKKLKSEKGIFTEHGREYFRLSSLWWILLMLPREKGISFSNYSWCKIP